MEVGKKKRERLNQTGSRTKVSSFDDRGSRNAQGKGGGRKHKLILVLGGGGGGGGGDGTYTSVVKGGGGSRSVSTWHSFLASKT